MQQPVKPENETERLAELCSMQLLDTAAEERFDRITRTVQKMFGTQMALISLVDADRQWFKSKQGLTAEETPREISFCGHAILGSGVFVVEDASLDPRFFDNPLVTQAPFIRFYAGVPVTGPLGFPLGTLCIIDEKPRVFSMQDQHTLIDMAAWVEAELGAGFYVNTALDSDARLAYLLGNVRDSILTLDHYGNIKSLNAAAENLFGFSEQSLLNKNICKLLSHFEQAEHFFSELMENCGKTNEMTSLTKEIMCQRYDASNVITECTLHREVVDEKTTYTLVFREISERKLAEKKLRENSLLLRSVMDCTTSYVHVRDLQGRYLYVNKEYEQVFQCESSAILGKNYRQVLPPELADKVAESERSLVQTGQTISTENQVKIGDQIHTYLVVRSPMFDEHGQVNGTCGVGMDITENRRLAKQMEETLASLRVSEERWAFALEGSGDGVWDWDIANSKVQFSTRWKSMLGHQDSEIGVELWEWSSRVHPDDMAFVMADVQANLEGKTHSFSNEHRIACKDGSYLWILDRGMVVQRDTAGKPLRMVGTHTDISHRKQLERLQTEFVSTVSHELRTPVTSIRGSLGLLEAGVLGVLPAKALAMVEMANRNCQRLIHLVNDILDMEKLLAGKMEMQIRNVSIDELLIQAIEANTTYASAFQVSYQYHLSEFKPEILADPDRLMQILNNLLSNAAKFSHTGGQVDIRIVPDGEQLRIEVQDYGVGIPQNFKSRMFEAFAQADSGDTRKQGSTGLGLHISKKMIQQMHGEIAYTSQENLGSTFWIKLPLVIESAIALHQ